MTSGPDLQAAFELMHSSFDDLPDVFKDDLAAFWTPFLRSCAAVVATAPELRKAVAPGAAQRLACARALSLGYETTAANIAAYLRDHFDPCLISPRDGDHRAFFTAYYRPEVRASRIRSFTFRERLFARPDDLVTLEPGQESAALRGLSSARRQSDGTLIPYLTRAEIDAGALGERARPLAYVADAIEAFMIHVQGSARLVLDDGQALDLTYAGRNGQPYTSIGKILIERGDIKLEDMTLERLKAWVRANGQEPGERGRALLHTNQSFIFFSSAPADAAAPGPIGAAGLPLTPFRSIAIDRSVWPYGLPFWIDVDAPWSSAHDTPFKRLVIGQDTGTAIVGPARADLFFGDGPQAGHLAGSVRHHGRMFVLLPKDGLR